MLGMSQPLLYIPNPFSFPQRPPEKDTTTPPPQPFPVYVSTDYSFSGLVSQRNIGRREKKYPKGSWRGCSQAKAGSEVASSRGGGRALHAEDLPPPCSKLGRRRLRRGCSKHGCCRPHPRGYGCIPRGTTSPSHDTGRGVGGAAFRAHGGDGGDTRGP